MNTLQNVKDDWVLYDGTWYNGQPVLLRIRQGLEEYIGHSKYPTGYRITWTFENPNERGYPSSADNGELERFENLIFDEIEKDSHAIVVAVVTNNGERDWTIYTSDPDETHERLINSIKNEPLFPINMMSSEDPSWEEFKGIKDNITNKFKEK